MMMLSSDLKVHVTFATLNTPTNVAVSIKGGIQWKMYPKQRTSRLYDLSITTSWKILWNTKYVTMSICEPSYGVNHRSMNVDL